MNYFNEIKNSNLSIKDKIKSAQAKFRELSKEFHPDTNPNINSELFIKLKDEYEQFLFDVQNTTFEIQTTTKTDKKTNIKKTKTKIKVSKMNREKISNSLGNLAQTITEIGADYLIRKFIK